MSNYRISDLSSYSNPDPVNDVIEIVDNTNNANKKISRNNLLGITSTPVGINDTQVLTAKTLTAPTINSPILGGTITGTYTLAGTPTFPSSVVTLTGSQTLTNKVLTSPTINAPTITNASITADAITGFTVSNTGTIYGVPVTLGSIAGSSVTNIPATSLGTGAITLGYAQITTTVTTTSTTSTQVAGLTATVTIPTGGRRIKITVFAQEYGNSTANANTYVEIWDGTVGSGTRLSFSDMFSSASNTYVPGITIAVLTPAAGSKTYNVGLKVGTGTGSLTASANAPAFILVEAI